MHWHEIGEETAPAAAIVIDLAPTFMSPDEAPQDLPPGPEQMQAEAAREHKADKVEEKPEETVEAKPDPEVQREELPAPNPEVALAPEPPKPETKPAPTESQVAAPVTSAPQIPKADRAAIAAAPTQAQASATDSNAVPAWKRQVVALLERKKRYPAAARARGEKGSAQLAFSIDRKGRVVAARIVKSSGSSALDGEALELVRRAEPFPPPPPVMPGAQIDLTVPLHFNVR
jgi:protein TonB